MDNILDGVNILDMTSEATTFISVFSPYVTFVLGIILAFFVVDFIVGVLSGLTRSKEERNQKPFFDYMKEEEDEDFLEDMNIRYGDRVREEVDDFY